MQAGNANQREATEYNNSHRTSHKTDTLPQVAESAGAVNGQDTGLYKLYNTNIHEMIENYKKEQYRE